ncbi:MAG: cell wall-binding repeat-containing protein [Peptococcaceae bacterium]|nr:cell wall-binding repeat-containing protein [Peptococcaceae bacterium]
MDKQRRKYVLLLFLSILLTCVSSKAVLAAGQIERIYGMNRFQTSVQIAYKMNPSKVYNVVLANGNGFADALAGVPLARQKNAPLLLVNDLPENSYDALLYVQKHLDPEGQIYLLGGTSVISESFIDALGRLGFDSAHIHRLAGVDRYATAVEIAKEMQHDGTEFFLVSGEDYPDALSASVAASLLGNVTAEEAQYLNNQGEVTSARLGGVPILLLPSRGEVPDSVLHYLNRLNPWLGRQAFHMVGGTAVVPDQIVQNLFSRMKYAGMLRTRYQGNNRYETSAAVNRIGFEIFYARQGKGNIIPRIYVASGTNYSDALNGAVLAAVNHAPLVLVSEVVDASTLALLREYAEKNRANGYTQTVITVIGTVKEVSDEAVRALSEVY